MIEETKKHEIYRTIMDSFYEVFGELMPGKKENIICEPDLNCFTTAAVGEFDNDNEEIKRKNTNIFEVSEESRQTNMKENLSVYSYCNNNFQKYSKFDTKTKKRKYKQYSAENLEAAKKDIKAGSTVKQASESHNIPYGTLYGKMKKQQLWDKLKKQQNVIVSEDNLQSWLQDIRNGKSFKLSCIKHNIPACLMLKWLNMKTVLSLESQDKSSSQGETEEGESNANNSMINSSENQSDEMELLEVEPRVAAPAPTESIICQECKKSFHISVDEEILVRHVNFCKTSLLIYKTNELVIFRGNE